MARIPIESKINSVIVPAFGNDPATLYIAADVPLRVIVRNIGGNVLFLSHESPTLETLPPGIAGTFQLPPGQSEVFVLQPRQGIYAAGGGNGGVASVAISEALMQAWLES